MANGDVYTIQVAAQTQGVAVSNSIWIRALADAIPGQELTTLLDLAETEIVPKMAEFTCQTTTFSCIAVRRASNPSTANSLRYVNVPGDIAGDQLPTTSYLKLRAYTIPYIAKQSQGFQFQGIPESETKDGLVTFTHVLRFGSLINFLLQDPITFAGNSYVWCSSVPYVPLDPPNPAIRKAHVVPCVYNSRNRQTSVCVV